MSTIYLLCTLRFILYCIEKMQEVMIYCILKC